MLPHVTHFMHVPLRTNVKFPHSLQLSPSNPLSLASARRSFLGDPTILGELLDVSVIPEVDTVEETTGSPFATARTSSLITTVSVLLALAILLCFR